MTYNVSKSLAIKFQALYTVIPSLLTRCKQPGPNIITSPGFYMVYLTGIPFYMKYSDSLNQRPS